MDRVSSREFQNLFYSIHASDNQEQTIRDFLTPFFEFIVSNRDKYEISDSKLIEALS